MAYPDAPTLPGPGNGPATVSEAPDQTNRPARVEMQDEAGASGLDPSAVGGGVGAAAQGLAEPFRPDLGDSVLRQAGAGGSGETGFLAGEIGAYGGALGSTLGASPDRPPDDRAPAADPDRDAANEQQAELMQQARAQGGEPQRSAPDQTRAEGRLGSINDTDGL